MNPTKDSSLLVNVVYNKKKHFYPCNFPLYSYLKPYATATEYASTTSTICNLATHNYPPRVVIRTNTKYGYFKEAENIFYWRDSVYV